MKRRREVFNRRQGIPDLMGNIAKYVVIAVLILFFISETKRMYALGYSIFSPKARDRAGEGITASVTVTSDMSDAAVARLLADEDLIESSMVFRVQLKFSEYDGKLTAGTYELSSEMLPEEMMELMSAGNAGDGSGEAAGEDSADAGESGNAEESADAGEIESP